MQIEQTEVCEASSSGNETLIRVTFHGEGGDRVTVDMARAELHDEEEAILRARAILLQVATFGVATDRNDHMESVAGNADDTSMFPGAPGEEGNLYTLEYRDGAGSRRTPPSWLPDDEAAREEAIRSAIDLLDDPAVQDVGGWLVRVRNQDGKLVFSVDAEEAKRARETQR